MMQVSFRLYYVNFTYIYIFYAPTDMNALKYLNVNYKTNILLRSIPVPLPQKIKSILVSGTLVKFMKRTMLTYYYYIYTCTNIFPRGSKENRNAAIHMRHLPTRFQLFLFDLARQTRQQYLEEEKH